MKLWQRKKVWINRMVKEKSSIYLWHAFFPKTTRKMAYIAWNTRHQRDFENENYRWYDSHFIWFNECSIDTLRLL